MKTIVLFGGTFDPIHYGHLKMMRAAIKQTGASEGWFLLADQAPLKDQIQTSFENRERMIETMIRPYKKMKVCTIEKDLPKPNYTIVTIDTLKRKYPNIQFKLLIGTDQALQFEEWKEHDRIHQEVEVLVFPRFDNKIDDKFTKLIGKPFEVSSTEIRLGHSIDTHPKILSEMIINGIYTEQLLSSYLPASRIKHSKEVAKLMVEFAHHYNLDVNRYYGLGMIHDLCKQLEKENKLDGYLSADDKKFPPYMWHAVAARNILVRFYKVKDRKFVNAIYHHVLGTGNTTEAMLLYISDKCERTRGYDSEPFIELTKKDIRKGFETVKNTSIIYNQKGVSE